LFEARAGKGLVVIGAPCNDFGAQESASERDIRDFCDASYHVTFPMTGKVEIVARDRRHPFFKWVASELGEECLPRWNFHKYLIGKGGRIADSFPSKAGPLGPNMLKAIDSALAA
jgi:glutathione peroxidase